MLLKFKIKNNAIFSTTNERQIFKSTLSVCSCICCVDTFYRRIEQKYTTKIVNSSAIHTLLMFFINECRFFCHCLPLCQLHVHKACESKSERKNLHSHTHSSHVELHGQNAIAEYINTDRSCLSSIYCSFKITESMRE